MKTGILLTQPAIPERDARFGNFADMSKLFLSSAGKTMQFAVYNLLNNEWPESAKECNAWFITGSVHSAYEDLPWINRLKEFIKSCHVGKQKLAGICFGHQIIAEALGGKVEKSVNGWGVGAYDFTVKTTCPWMVPPLRHVNLLYSHQDQVTKLPEGSVLIGGDSFCTNRMYAIGNHILSIQGHPEFTVEFERYLLEARKNILPVPVYERGVQSLSAELDSAQMAHWIVNFYTS